MHMHMHACMRMQIVLFGDVKNRTDVAKYGVYRHGAVKVSANDVPLRVAGGRKGRHHPSEPQWLEVPLGLKVKARGRNKLFVSVICGVGICGVRFCVIPNVLWLGFSAEFGVYLFLGRLFFGGLSTVVISGGCAPENNPILFSETVVVVIVGFATFEKAFPVGSINERSGLKSAFTICIGR